MRAWSNFSNYQVVQTVNWWPSFIKSISDQLKQIGYFQLDIKRTAISANPMCAMLDGADDTDEHTLEIN